MQSQVRFNMVPEKVPEKVWEASVQSQVKFKGSGEGSGEGLGSFGAEPGRIQQGSEEGSGEGLGGFGAGKVRFNRVTEKVPEPEVWEALVQSHVKSNMVPEKVLGGFGAEPGEVQQGSGKRFREALVQSQVMFSRVPEKVPEKVWEALVQSQVRFNRICGHLIHGSRAEVFRALGFPARFRQICKNKTLRLLGIPPKLFLGREREREKEKKQKNNSSHGMDLSNNLTFPSMNVSLGISWFTTA